MSEPQIERTSIGKVEIELTRGDIARQPGFDAGSPATTAWTARRRSTPVAGAPGSAPVAAADTLRR